jgi:hypothetical protein
MITHERQLPCRPPGRRKRQNALVTSRFAPRVPLAMPNDDDEMSALADMWAAHVVDRSMPRALRCSRAARGEIASRSVASSAEIRPPVVGSAGRWGILPRAGMSARADMLAGAAAFDRASRRASDARHAGGRGTGLASAMDEPPCTRDGWTRQHEKEAR